MRVGLSYDLLRLSPCSSIWKQIVRLQYSAPHLKNLSKHPIKLNNPPKPKAYPIYLSKQSNKTFFISYFIFISDQLLKILRNFLQFIFFFSILYFQFFIFSIYNFMLVINYSKYLEIFYNFLYKFFYIFIYKFFFFI